MYTINRRRKIVLRINKGDNDILMKGWLQKDWSTWHDILDLETPKSVDGWERRTGGIGYRLNSDHVSRIFTQRGGDTCGIYELRAVRRRTSYVVYVGCSCQKDGKSLPARINSYCNDGSHKAALIDDALKKGYTLSFRYKPASNMAQAEEDEKLLLINYNYEWNEIKIAGTLPD